MTDLVVEITQKAMPPKSWDRPGDTIERLLDGAILAESPEWDPDASALFCVDIENHSVLRLDFKSATVTTFHLTRRCTALALADDGTLIVLAETHISSVHRTSGEVVWEMDLAEHFDDGEIFNDTGTDPLGRLWFGTRHRDRVPGRGHLYSIDADFEVTRHPGRYTVTNGIVWSADGTTLFVNDSTERVIHRYTASDEDGHVGEPETLMSFAGREGRPDGLAMDADGNVWCAVWDEGQILRLRPTGELVESIQVPFPRPTSCIFGEDMSTLFVTSAALDEWRGGVHRLRVETTGRIEPLTSVRH